MTKLTHSDLQWCLRRCPKNILEALKARPGKAYVAGGFIRSCIAREEINDVDIFVPSKQMGKSLAQELAKKSKEGEVSEPKRIFESDNAYTVFGYGITPQVIHRWTFENPSQCVESFDFTIACAAFWWSPGDPMMGVGPSWQSVCDERFYPDLAAKRLSYRSPIRNEDAGGSLLRVLKFYTRGYRIPVDSLGAVISRLCQGLRMETLAGTEDNLAQVFTGLLREVDPAVDPKHIAHLPAENCKDGVDE